MRILIFPFELYYFSGRQNFFLFSMCFFQKHLAALGRPIGSKVSRIQILHLRSLQSTRGHEASIQRAMWQTTVSITKYFKVSWGFRKETRSSLGHQGVRVSWCVWVRAESSLPGNKDQKEWVVEMRPKPVTEIWNSCQHLKLGIFLASLWKLEDLAILGICHNWLKLTRT